MSNVLGSVGLEGYKQTMKAPAMERQRINRVV